MKLKQLADDPAPMPSKVTTPDGTTKKKTEDGTWLLPGATDYHQMDTDRDFGQPTPIDGHKQEKNVNEEEDKACKACGGSGENSKGSMCGACRGKKVKQPPLLKKSKYTSPESSSD